MDKSPTRYDLVAYPSYTHPQTHPGRLAVIGTLAGLTPAPPHACRVLELGCGDASNLAPMAWALPRGEFTGIDLAARPIERGRRMAKDLQLANLRLLQGSITEIDKNWGTFDYIIAHGVYSWVPREVQESLLSVCGNLLAPNGIAFVSYNALPGCHARKMLREMMLFHVRNSSGAEERLRQARAFAGFLADGAPANDEYRSFMAGELRRIIEYEPGHLFHDDLADNNEPLYFTQFMERASRHGLQYLGEADYFETTDFMFNEQTREALAGLSSNRILREQYFDFLKCRRFRQTLLCRRETPLRLEPKPDMLAAFYVSCPAKCAEGPIDLRPGIDCTFATPKGARVTTDLAAGKAALAALSRIWPAPMAFDELRHQAEHALREAGVNSADGTASAEVLQEFLMRLYGAGAVDFQTVAPSAVRAAGERPVVHPIARWQADHGETVTSLFHIAVKIEDEIGRWLLRSLDGTLDRTALLEQLWLKLKSLDALAIQDGNEPAAKRDIALRLEENLNKLAQLGMLIA